jgi:DNA-binding transcriptional LysR family regulator
MARKLPPLKMLQTLEAVVRLGGISLAANELGVTHGAVSKQISLLEDWLGRPLFDRERHRFRAYDETADFGKAIGAGLDQLEAASNCLKTAHRQLKVVAQASFAMHWLVPRLDQFYALNPDIDVHVQTRQTGESLKLFPCDVAILRGEERIANWQAYPILQEHITLLTTQEGASLFASEGISGLVGKTLAVADTRPGEAEQWLRETGLPPLAQWRVRRFGHFHTLLMAVLNGQGFAVGPIELSGGKVTDALLAAPFPDLTIQGPSHVAFIDPVAAIHPVAKRFVLWLRETASRP